MANAWDIVGQSPLPASGPWDVVSQEPASTNVGQMVHQGLSGIDEGIANFAGMPVDLANAGIGLAESGINRLAGTNFQPSPQPLFGSADIKRNMMGPMIAPPTANPTDRFVRRTGQEVGSMIVPGMGAAAGAARPAATLFSSLGSGLGAGLGAATAQQVAPDNTTAEMAGELAGGLSPFVAANALKKSAAKMTVQEVKRAAGQQYDLAEKMGATATQPQTQQLAADLHDIAAKEGLVSPTGRISTAYPKAREALLMADDYAAGTMTVPQMKAFRKTLSDAVNSSDSSERRIAMMMLHKFDDFTAPLAPPLEAARALYSKAMKGNTLETLNELAASKAGQFTGSGMENARKTEYRGLERNIIKGNEPGFTPVEQAAVSKVAQGSKPGRLFSAVGRGAVKGPVSAMSTVGVPFMIGNAIAGPAGGVAATTTAMAATYAARAVATKLGEKAANEALQLVLRGGPQVASKMSLTDTQRRAVSALLAEMAAN